MQLYVSFFFMDMNADKKNDIKLLNSCVSIHVKNWLVSTYRVSLLV